MIIGMHYIALALMILGIFHDFIVFINIAAGMIFGLGVGLILCYHLNIRSERKWISEFDGHLTQILRKQERFDTRTERCEDPFR